MTLFQKIFSTNASASVILIRLMVAMRQKAKTSLISRDAPFFENLREITQSV